MSFFAELKRRNVFRVGAAYVAVSWLTIQVVETLFSLFGWSEAIGRIVVIVLAIGFVPTMILAWAFQLTPEGLKRDADVDYASPLISQMGKRLDRLILVFLALALGYFAFDKFVLDPARDAEELATATGVAREEGRSEALEQVRDNSIAVLAFQDLSPAGDQEYFSDGISEELLNLLARIPELRVTGKTSAFSFKDKDATIVEIGEVLNVSHVLEGSVRISGDRIRITAQLINARTDTNLWSQTFDRMQGDIFAIQDEIAAEVVEQLQVTLLGAVPRTRRTDPRAHALTLQAKHIHESGARGTGEQMAALLEEALALDPDYVPAMNWLVYANF
jgi:adenylate cyclase